MKRLWQFVGFGTGLAITAILVLYYFTEPIFVAAFLGAWPAFIIAAYDRFVNVPLISFDKKGIRKDSLQVIDRGGVIWTFLRLPINNSGFAPARNCTAELGVLGRPRKNGQSCPSPFDETKGLKWSGRNPRESHTIPSRRGSAIIDILVDDTSIVPATRLAWHGAKEWGPLTLWAGTHEVFGMSPVTRAQDAFCQGDYVVEVTVFPENGAPKSETFELNVDGDWNKTSLVPSREATEVKKKMLESKAGQDGTQKVASGDVAAFHERANHEDILHTRRLGLFLSFNAFLAVAVGLTQESFLRIVFTVIGIVVGVFWILWAPNAGIFIRALRNAGMSRADERLWNEEIRQRDERCKGLLAPLKILNYYLPSLLIVGWIMILFHTIYTIFLNKSISP